MASKIKREEQNYLLSYVLQSPTPERVPMKLTSLASIGCAFMLAGCASVDTEYAKKSAAGAQADATPLTGSRLAPRGTTSPVKTITPEEYASSRTSVIPNQKPGG